MSSLSSKKRCTHSIDDNMDERTELSVLDLPELALECILLKLPPTALSNMAAVCSSLRERCRSDYLWENHLTEKWGKLIGSGARREWHLYLASAKDNSNGIAEVAHQKKWFGSLARMWPISWIKSKIENGNKLPNCVPDNSIMSWYQSIESGKFWFPAQVYNREHGHVGFLLSCYDAEVSYDCHTDTFKARYPPHGRRAVVLEEGIKWERIRAPPVDTSTYDLHISECLDELCPGNHIEIQWRRNKAFPYGWWYGVVGHLDSCDGNEQFCRCHLSDTIFLEFTQYAPDSRWRRTKISRKDHKEEGSEADGFYGGIRKLRDNDEITKWKKHWPNDVLE